MSDIGAIGVILFDCKVLMEELNNYHPSSEYEYGIQLINHIIDEIEKQGIDLEGRDVEDIYDLIRDMRNRLETRESVTSTINRIKYSDVLDVLRNFTEFQYNRNIKLKIILQDGLMTIQMEEDK